MIGIKEYAIKTMYKHTNQDDGLMSIVDLAKIAESYKMEAELEDELLQQLWPNSVTNGVTNGESWAAQRALC